MRKKLIVLGTVALITACSVTFAACSSSATSASLYSTWYNRIDYGGIQPRINGQIEEAEYDIGFKEGSNDGYEIFVATEDENGEPYKMHTRFYTLEYDWSDPVSVIKADEYSHLSNIALPDFPDGYGPEDPDDNSEIVYVYSMYYSVPVTYVSKDFDGEDSYTFPSTHYSICYFRTVNKSMMPVFSYEYSLSVPPSNPSVLSELLMYAFSFRDTVYYNYDCTECTCICNDVEPEDLSIYQLETESRSEPVDIYQHTEDDSTVVDLNESENEFFDNASIYMVMRALNYYSASSFSADVFIPTEKKFSTYTMSGGVESVLNPNDPDQEKMLTAMWEAGYFDDDTSSSDEEITGDESPEEDGDPDDTDIGEETAENETTLPNNIYYSNVTLSLDADLTGPSQEVWFAAAEGEAAFRNENYTRATMLYISIPFAYTLGTTTFTLCKVSSHFDEYAD